MCLYMCVVRVWVVFVAVTCKVTVNVQEQMCELKIVNY